MRARRYAVQFLYRVSDNSRGLSTLIEQLRYAGLLSIIKETDYENPDPTGSDYGVNGVYRLHAPAGVDTKVWAEQNAARMKTFSINAEVVPEI